MTEVLMLVFIYGSAIAGAIAGVGLIVLALRNDK